MLLHTPSPASIHPAPGPQGGAGRNPRAGSRIRTGARRTHRSTPPHTAHVQYTSPHDAGDIIAPAVSIVLELDARRKFTSPRLTRHTSWIHHDKGVVVLQQPSDQHCISNTRVTARFCRSRHSPTECRMEASPSSEFHSRISSGPPAL